MGEDLRNELLELGFLMVLGTVEVSAVRHFTAHVDGDGQLVLVGKGEPKHWDSNNGTTVVYDQEGYPWIKSSKFFGTEGVPLTAVMRRHGLTRGAYVPHSNDGGTWKRYLFEQTGVEV